MPKPSFEPSDDTKILADYFRTFQEGALYTWEDITKEMHRHWPDKDVRQMQGSLRTARKILQREGVIIAPPLHADGKRIRAGLGLMRFAPKVIANTQGQRAKIRVRREAHRQRDKIMTSVRSGRLENEDLAKATNGVGFCNLTIYWTGAKKAKEIATATMQGLSAMAADYNKKLIEHLDKGKSAKK